MTELHLVNNQLSGGIPSWLGDLKELTVLNLNSNPLGGKIPEQLGGLKALDAARPPQQPAEWWDPVVAG